MFQGVLDGVHVIVIVVAKGLPSHFAPDQFLGVALGTVSRQPAQRQIVRDDQRLGPMSVRPIQEHQEVFVWMPPGHFRQIK